VNAVRGAEKTSSEELRVRAQRLVDDVLTPIIAADGGSIELVSAASNKLVLRLSGTCAGCPGRPYTLQGVIEPAARKVLGADVRVDLATDAPPYP
jgi:Fe-S cluster biogenesis protein NfuA